MKRTSALKRELAVTTAELSRAHAEIRVLERQLDAARLRAAQVVGITSEQATKTLTDAISGQLGCKVSQSSYMPGKGAGARY